LCYRLTVFSVAAIDAFPDSSGTVSHGDDDRLSTLRAQRHPMAPREVQSRAVVKLSQGPERHAKTLGPTISQIKRKRIEEHWG